MRYDFCMVLMYPPMYGSKLKKMRMIFDFRLLGMQFIIEVVLIEICVDFVRFSLRIGVLGLAGECWVIDCKDEI